MQEKKQKFDLLLYKIEKYCSFENPSHQIEETIIYNFCLQ